MIKLAIFSLDDLRFPSPAIRVMEPNLWLQSLVHLLNGHVISDGQSYADPQALDEADIVLVQRGFPRSSTKHLCERILSSGKPIIYETDDALQHVPEHHGKPGYRDDAGPAIEEFVKHADLVTVATPALGTLFRKLTPSVIVLPNYLSPNLWTDELLALHRAAQSDKVKIGFVGSKNHDRDFAAFAPVLKEALERYPGVELVSYGGISAGLEESSRIKVIPPHYHYAGHPRRLAGLGIDIAFTPLTPSRFNRSKSNIKFLEFGFLGIPGVFSDLEPYRDTVIHSQNGFLCDQRPASWREVLFALIEDTQLRKRIGDAARETVHRAWMLDKHADEWLRAYDVAIRTHSKSRARARR